MSQRQPWDLGRFFQTLTYFEIIPFIGSNSWLRNMILGNETPPARPNIKKTGTILVAGATGRLGQRVVKHLLQNNYQVRVLVRSIKEAKPILGEGIDYYEGDITIPASLKPELMADVTAVISCIGSRVQPGGENTSQQPQEVEYQGMTNLINLAANHLPNPKETTVFDFSQPSADMKSTWGAVDDVVMGGVSASNLRLVSGIALFSGNVSTANSGGFVSVRNRNFEPPLDLSGYDGIQLRVKGDGKRYKLIMRSEGKWDGISYCYSFDTIYNYDLTISIPFADLRPVFRAKTLTDVGAFDASKVYSIQLMLSKFEYDGELNPKFEAGAFQLQIESIKAYKNKPTPQFVMVSSAGVTRPSRPGINLEEQIPIVQMNEMLGGILTWKLKGEDVLRSSGLTHTIIRPCALTEEPGGKALLFEQGDNLTGKVSREDVAKLCVKAIESGESSNKTFEVAQQETNQSQDLQQLWRNLQPD